MSTKRKKKPAKPFGINQCSVCDVVTITVGTQKIGGIRYCRDCVKLTLGWVQFSESEREGLMKFFDDVAAQPGVQKALDAAAAIPEETRKAAAIGESRRRLIDAEIRETRGY